MKRVLLFALVATISLRTSAGVSIPDHDRRVEEGNDVTMTCLDGDIPIDWEFDGNSISDGGRYSIVESGGDSTLTISNVTREDSGDYKCTDSDGNTFTLELTVYIVPIVKVTSVPPSRQITVGENRTLTCETNAYKDRIEWTKNGRDVSQMTNIVVEEDNLTIVNTEWTDAGVYECFINITDLANKKIIEGDKFDLVAPVNIMLTKNVKLEEGETARIGCNATGYPSPTLTWYKGDKQMVNGSIDGRVFVTIVEDQGDATVVISTINIRRIVSDDAGVYTCNATNNHTTAGEAYQLEVRDPLAALWPFLGIMLEVIILIALILGVECYQKNKAAQNK